MSKLAGILGTGALAASAALFTPQAHAQLQAQSPRAMTQVQCSSTALHFTERGFAFECADPRNENFYIFVVKPSQDYDRIEEVVATLREFNSRGSTGQGRTRTQMGLWVKFRNAGGPEQTICNEVWGQLGPNARCAVATDIGYR